MLQSVLNRKYEKWTHVCSVASHQPSDVLYFRRMGTPVVPRQLQQTLLRIVAVSCAGSLSAQQLTAVPHLLGLLMTAPYFVHRLAPAVVHFKSSDSGQYFVQCGLSPRIGRLNFQCPP